AMHAFWAAALALAPRPLARHLLAERFIFNRRSFLAEALLQCIWHLGRLTRMISRRQGGPAAVTPSLAESPISLPAAGQYQGER
ncbi:MAG: hypothetical protein ACR2RE_17185, partial [Geminicoccaceae bacterium]